MSEEKALEIASWLRQQSQSIRYGTVTVSLSLHDGQIRTIDKTTSEKERLVTATS